MNKHLSRLLLLCAAALPLTSMAEATKAAPPFNNPFLAHSTNSVAHKNASRVSVAGPTGPSRRLNADEVTWKPVGPVNGWDVMISSPYPNGKRVIWVGGYDRVSKIDADTMEVLTTYGIGGNSFFTQEEVERDIATLDKADDQHIIEVNKKFWAEPIKYVETGYRMLSSKNEYYMSHRSQTDHMLSVRVYGEADPADPSSAISLKREWKFPAEFQKPTVANMSMNMTSDGHVVVVLSDGTMFVLSQDFKNYYTLTLPRNKAVDESVGKDFFASFVRNSVTVDDHGGIYVVSRDFMHRVQWTGSRLSLDEADGAWSETYNNDQGIGSGTTPQSIGWGPDEDHLVTITDGAKPNNNMVVYWRDKIPDDWKGIPGQPRRLAGITPIRFGIPGQPVRIENSPVVNGYGVFFNNTVPVQPLPDQGGNMNQFMAEVFYMFAPGHEALGGAMIRWNPATRALVPAWQTQLNLVSAVCKVSDISNTTYCWGNRNREWTVEGFDWSTGKNTFHYTLGKSQRYNPLGGTIVIAPDGAIMCGCTGGMGFVRVKPKETRAHHK